jgi:hypothetical protein
VRLYSVHAERPASVPASGAAAKPRPPVLLREGFCLPAALFGPLWFAANRLWAEAALLLALSLGALLLPDTAAGLAIATMHIIAGFEARDRQRARLARQGLVELGVVAGEDLDLAWFRLGQQRPDLVKALP